MKAVIFSAWILCFLFSCSSGKKALEQGDYDQAVSQSVNRLQSKSDHKKAKSTLKKAYPLAVSVHQTNITRLENSVDPFRWEKIVFEYNAINSLYNLIQRCPSCQRYIKDPLLITNQLNSAKEKAAQSRYEMGTRALRSKENRIKAIEAHQHFREVLNFVPGYKDTESHLDEALYYATLRVVVEPIPSPVRSFDINQEFFTNKINEYLHNSQIDPYVRFYTPEEVIQSDPGWVDHVIYMEFDRFSLGNVHSNTYVEEVSRDSVLLETSNGEEVYGTVRAKLKINTKSISGNGVLDFQIKDINLNKVISQEKFPSQYEWSIRWATFNGDERALSKEQKELVNSVEMDIPGPQRMFEEFAAPLYDQVITKINQFYRKY